MDLLVGKAHTVAEVKHMGFHSAPFNWNGWRMPSSKDTASCTQVSAAPLSCCAHILPGCSPQIPMCFHREPQARTYTPAMCWHTIAALDQDCVGTQWASVKQERAPQPIQWDSRGNTGLRG